MIRKQIYLKENMISKIKQLAQKNNISESEIIRRAISVFIRKEQLKGEVRDPLLELIGLGKSELDVDAGDHHEYSYRGDGDE